MSSAQAQPDAAVLAGRVVLVTGAAGGLGAAAAQACAAAGATVVLLGRKVRPLERVYDAVAISGPEPLLYPLDLAGATPDDYGALAQRLQSELGGLHGLLHCAADFAGLTPAELAAPADFARNLHVNLTARAWLTQACLPLLRQQRDAAVVLVVDDPARVGQAYWGAYGAAQHAQRGLLSSLHHETAAGPVRISGLQPGPMRTALRARAFTHQEDSDAVDPARYAPACVTLLSMAGAAQRGAIWSPSV
ncbi:SDR family NAD(P)-dependent oxidoreductase [Xanthomonas sp. 3075]|uniref:SDR family NAD(P)-dependent oxidoreductase n=1 Tax=Xanthomonas sp. 3075 TaxID=3035315 RepID=UPI00161D3BF6|nr:SDR family NAD(P)-dependent oxidoreductase [Xanthomonas sp. 3075]MBB4130210.1 NAD(P)-dependent dehydrogenase (short-subunit alcohol dehydrogenase family) [Xanthomonas sp. 3075]